MSRSQILAHYATGCEAARLESGPGRLERNRTEEILTRHLPPAPAVIVDAGGGTGRYASWLATRGCTVHLLDLTPLHVEQAHATFQSLGLGNATALVGDARALPFDDASADAVLLLGPLYHLPDRADRQLVLQEAMRVVKPGGPIAAAGISRFASLFDGYFHGFISDPDFARIVDRDLEDGRHENTTSNPLYFTTSYFHDPAELAAELAEAGFIDCTLIAVEGPFWCVPDFDALWSDEGARERLLRYLRRVEREPSLIGASAHLLVIASRPN